MKRIIVTLFAVAIALSVSAGAWAQSAKIGYVDVLKVFNDYDKTKEYEKSLDIKKKEIEKKLIAKREEIEKGKSKLSLLKEDKKAGAEEKLRDQLKEYEVIGRKAEADMKRIVIDQMTEIKGDMDKVIQRYAKSNKFDFILDANSVLYGNAGSDLTDEILAITNKAYKK